MPVHDGDGALGGQEDGECATSTGGGGDHRGGGGRGRVGGDTVVRGVGSF